MVEVKEREEFVVSSPLGPVTILRYDDERVFLRYYNGAKHYSASWTSRSGVGLDSGCATPLRELAAMWEKWAPELQKLAVAWDRDHPA